jgi:anti-sigma B factor antagonist
MTLEMESETELLQIGLSRSEGMIVLSLSGELDIAGAPLLREYLFDAVRSGDQVGCDLEHLTYMDSTGISLLISARKSLKATGRELILFGLSEPVHKVLEITGVASYFTIQPRWSPAPE